MLWVQKSQNLDPGESSIYNSYKVEFFDQEANDGGRHKELETLEGRHLKAAKVMASARDSAA